MTHTPERLLCCMLACWLILVAPAQGQRIIVNSQGDRIVMYPDGSWRPVEPGDSVLIRQYLQRADVIQPDPGPVPGNRERTKAEAHEHLLRQWNEMYALLLAEDKSVMDEFRTAANAQFNAGAQLSNAETNKKLMEPDQLAALRDAYDASIQKLRVAKLRSKKIKSLVNRGTKLNERPNALTESKINGLRTQFQAYASEFALHASGQTFPDTPRVQNPKPTEPRHKNIQETKPVDSKPVEKKPTAGVSPHSELPAHRKNKPYTARKPDCQFTTEVVDEASGRKKMEMEYATLFSHTDPDLRPYFKDRDLITCAGKLSKSGPYVYLNVRFVIASSHSQKNFGALQSGSLLRLKLLNGDFVSLYNLKSDRGHIDAYSGHTVFTGQYALGKDEIKPLLRSEVDKIRVLWATGYEDYEVYYVDFFIHQLDCIQSKK